MKFVLKISEGGMNFRQPPFPGLANPTSNFVSFPRFRRAASENASGGGQTILTMKNQCLFLLPVLLGACMGYKELPVEYDYSYRGQFKKYRTFDMLNAAGINDSTMQNAYIEKFIIARMKFLGYRQTERKPHLIIGYKMFADSLNFNGYLQPDIEEWVRTQPENVRYEKQKFNLRTGTLLIQFYDRRQERSIWQGYATTVYGAIDFSNQRHLRNAVISILDKYRFWADGFVEGGIPAADEDAIK
jgi:hypothetical protein